MNLANKLDSLLLVLHKTLNTLEQLDARQSKLLLKNFEFHCKEIFSKDESIEYLLETEKSRWSYINEKSRGTTRKMFFNNKNIAKPTKTTTTTCFT